MRAAFAHLQEAVEALQGADLGAESKGAAFAADVLSAGLAEAQESAGARARARAGRAAGHSHCPNELSALRVGLRRVRWLRH